MDADTAEDLRSLFTGDYLDVIVKTGYRKPLQKFVLSEKSQPLSIFFDFHIMAKSKAELDQLVQGLELFQFISMVRLHPVIWETYFLFRDSCSAPLTPGLLGINWFRSMYMHGRELSTLVVILSVYLSVCHHGNSFSGLQT